MARYPEIEPFEQGMLDVGDGHRLYWELCGNPLGKPAVALHGGPGSGCTPATRRYFDPKRFHVLLFDQRGCGRSTPHAGRSLAALEANTTEHLIADIERLRALAGVERWLVFGGSWGSTLALAYAERHPARVSEMVLSQVATTSRAEIEWITSGVGRFFPEAWARFRDGVPEAARAGNLAAAYHRLLTAADPAISEKAAADWCEWEKAIVDVTPGHRPHPRYDDPTFRLGFARLVTHYWAHAAWLEEDVLIRKAGRLAPIPGALVHGRLDLGSPIETAWRLNRAWPGSRLHTVNTAGHDGRDPGLAETVVAALDRFAGEA